MLRDIPRIYMLMFGFVAVIVVLIYWYTSMFKQGADTTVLNEALLSGAVSEVDQSSRVYEGVLLLANTFEPVVFESINDMYPEGSVVQFDYKFDKEDDRFSGVDSATRPSPEYVIGDDTARHPQSDAVTYMLGRPILSVRVKVHEPGDEIGNWTYVSTIAVDAATD